MNRRRILLLSLAVLILAAAGALVFYAVRQVDTPGEKVQPLQEYGVEFWDSPQLVAEKLGVSMSGGEKGESAASDYCCQAKLFGYDAEIWFDFYDDRKLTDVSIIVACGGEEAAEALKEKVTEDLVETYSAEERYRRNDAYHSFYDAVVTDIELPDGPYGMSYTLYASDGELVISCHYQYD